MTVSLTSIRNVIFLVHIEALLGVFVIRAEQAGCDILIERE